MSTTKRTSAKIGVFFLVAAVLFASVLFSKDRIATTLMGGATIKINFASDYKLRPFVSRVKVGFVPVGRVSAVDRAPDGSAIVSVKVERDALDHLGSTPRAVIRPTTILGGSYFVDLQAGGDAGRFGGTEIGKAHTEVPVELGNVVESLQPDALAGAQASLGDLQGALDPSGRAAVDRLMKTLPDTLPATSRLLAAAQGTRPHADLAGVVTGIEGTARALTKKEGQLNRILTNLDTTSALLDRRSGDLSSALARLPRALDNTRTGLHDLSGTLTTLREVSAETRPTAKELGTTLEAVRPVLTKARPVINDLRSVVADARPSLTDLVPTASSARGVITDVQGPVIDRVNGPVMTWLHAPYTGTGKYSHTQSKKPMFEETVFALVDAARASSMVDGNGHAISFQVGIGSGSVGGLPISLEQYTKLMSTWLYGGEDGGPALPRSKSSTVSQTSNALLGLLLRGRN